MSIIKPYTTTVDKWSAILPPVGFLVGGIGALSNAAGALVDIPKIAFAAYHFRGSEQMPDANRFKLAIDYSEAKQDFLQHLTSIVIYVLRMIPFAGGMLTYSYHSNQSKQLIQAGDAAKNRRSYELAKTLYEKAVALNGSDIAKHNIRDLKVSRKVKLTGFDKIIDVCLRPLIPFIIIASPFIYLGNLFSKLKPNQS